MTWREQLATEVGMTYSLEWLKKEWEEEIKGKQGFSGGLLSSRRENRLVASRGYGVKKGFLFLDGEGSCNMLLC